MPQEFDLKTELAILPDSPGVYIMHNAQDKVIYVGKAKILKNRVRQYFHNSAAHTPKVRAMVENVAYFEYIVTDSEKEALVLECNLIKKYRPKYNILLKDDKQYPYIKVTMQDEYPRIRMARRVEKDGARYFGPYMGTTTIKNAIEVVQKIFKPATCRRVFPRDIGKARPCLNKHIGRCVAPCAGSISVEDYRAIFEDICKFLEGDYKNALAELNEQMTAASLAMNYEQAARLRDQIFAIERLDEKQKITKAGNHQNSDVISFCTLGENAFFSVFFVRDGKLIGRERYTVEHVHDDNDYELLTDFVKQFYSDSMFIPSEILIKNDVYDRESIEEWLTDAASHKVTLNVPSRGDKLRLLEMSTKNAEVARDNFIAEEQRLGKNRVLDDLQLTLGLDKHLARIEAYDISNISGEDSVGAMVVFVEGKPAKSLYRKFKINTVDGADDYASTQEVIYRRLTHAIEEKRQIEAGELLPSQAKFLPLPDLILADGGKGHVNAIIEMVGAVGLSIPVFGMVKDDHHRTRGLVSETDELSVAPKSPVFALITRIQDEVHRYAISYFHKLHTKKSFTSVLDDIEGIGKKRRMALLNEYGSVEEIKKQSEEALSTLIGKSAAHNVYVVLHDEL